MAYLHSENDDLLVIFFWACYMLQVIFLDIINTWYVYQSNSDLV